MRWTLDRVEYRAVDLHRGKLCSEWGREVSFEEAQSHWEEHCAADWRRERYAHMCAMQRDEIARHTWIESEKADQDLGLDAKLDWVRRYAAQWREWYETQYDGGDI